MPAPNPLRILIIDDNPDDRLLAMRELQRAFPSSQIEPAATRLEFEQAMEAGDFDVVVTDYQLRWGTGLEALRAIKARYPDRPVVMFTNTAGQVEAVEAMKEGLDDFVIKAPSHYIRLPVAVEAARGRAADRLQAAEAQAAREEFLRLAAHELGTPLASIRLNLELLQRRLTQLSERAPVSEREELSTLASVAERSVRRTQTLDRLAQEMAEAVRLGKDELELQVADIDLVTIVGEAVDEQRLSWPSRGFDVEAPVSLRVEADPDSVFELLVHLLSNAVKFSAPDQPVAVTVARDVEGASARVTIRDRGVTIPAAERERIWEPFYRAPSIEHRSGSSLGLGLGLALCRRLAARMGGATGLDTPPDGNGNAFWFTLPLAGEP